MSDNTLRNGVRRVVASVPQSDHVCENTVAVVVTGGAVPWVLRFWARFGVHRAYIGAIRMFPSALQRVVAICSMPGARAWEVEGRSYDANEDNLEVHFEGIEARGGPWGVQALPGLSVDCARSYRVVTGSAGVVSVTGEVWGWAATAIAAGASVSVAALPALGFGPIAVPVNGEVNGNARGILAPISTWTFVGTNHYLIEYMPPGEAFDG